MQYSSASPPLEVQLAEMFSGGGILRDARLGGMHVGRLMAKVAASFESLKEHQADEIAALKRGFQLEIEKLFANIPADKREAREGVVIVAPDALYDETQTSHEGSDPSPCSEESSEQAITASGTETLLLLNNDIRESDPVLLAEGPMTSPDPHSKQLKMHDSLRLVLRNSMLVS